MIEIRTFLKQYLFSMTRLKAVRFSNIQYLLHLKIFASSSLTKGEVNKADLEIPFQNYFDVWISKQIQNIAVYKYECTLSILCNLGNSGGYLLQILYKLILSDKESFKFMYFAQWIEI